MAHILYVFPLLRLQSEMNLLNKRQNDRLFLHEQNHIHLRNYNIAMLVCATAMLPTGVLAVTVVIISVLGACKRVTIISTITFCSLPSEQTLST